jgi:hypothetical protein
MDPKERKLSAFARRKTRIAHLGSVWHQAGENIRHQLHSRAAAALPAAGRPALLVHRHARSRLAFRAILSPPPPAPSSACKTIMLQTTAAPAASLPAASSPGAPAFPPPTQKVEQFACFATLRKIWTQSLVGAVGTSEPASFSEQHVPLPCVHVRLAPAVIKFRPSPLLPPRHGRLRRRRPAMRRTPRETPRAMDSGRAVRAGPCRSRPRDPRRRCVRRAGPESQTARQERRWRRSGEGGAEIHSRTRAGGHLSRPAAQHGRPAGAGRCPGRSRRRIRADQRIRSRVVRTRWRC